MSPAFSRYRIMAIGDRAWCDRAVVASAPFYTTPEASANALRGAARLLVERGHPPRLCEGHSPQELSPWMIDRLTFFAVALGRLEQDDPLAAAAIQRYDLDDSWPRGGRWCRALACSFEDARNAAWRGWMKMAGWIRDNGTEEA